ncbi:hypothetical protein Tco_1024680 [Tanacetum coccineum]
MAEKGVRYKPHDKTPYELFLVRKPALSFMRPFGYPVTILNTLDRLGNQTNGNACTKANIDAGQAGKKIVSDPQYVLLPFLTSNSQGPKSSNDEVADDAGKKNEAHDPAKKVRRMMLEIKKRLLENNLDKKLKDCLVKGRLTILTALTELITV